MNNLGRDKLRPPEVWTEIDKAVMAEVGRLRTAQKVFLAQQTPNVANVSAEILIQQTQEQPLMIQEGRTLPFIEISFEFALSQNQEETRQHCIRPGYWREWLLDRSLRLSSQINKI